MPRTGTMSLVLYSIGQSTQSLPRFKREEKYTLPLYEEVARSHCRRACWLAFIVAAVCGNHDHILEKLPSLVLYHALKNWSFHLESAGTGPGFYLESFGCKKQRHTPSYLKKNIVLIEKKYNRLPLKQESPQAPALPPGLYWNVGMCGLPLLGEHCAHKSDLS